jgi:drug/metabolite transporter (DMT)-like permease
METLWLVLTNVLGGACYPGITVALRGFSGRDVALLRVAMCALLFTPVLLRARRRLCQVSGRDWALMACVGFFGYTVPLALGICGQKLSTATAASLLLSLEPVSIVLLSCLFLGERITKTKILAFAAGFSGVLLITFQGVPRMGLALTGTMTGNLMLAAAGVLWALYTVIGKPLLTRVRPLDFTAVTTVFAFLGVALWAGPRVSTAAWRSVGAGPWLAVFFTSLGGSFLGALLWNLALAGADASKVANFIFLQPLVGVASGAWLLGEPLTAWTLAGGALVLAGVGAATKSDY